MADSAVPMEDNPNTSPKQSDINFSEKKAMEIHGEICCPDEVPKDGDPSGKSSTIFLNANAEASSSSAVLEKSTSSSKLNAKAPEFIPRTQAVQMNAQAAGSIPPYAGEYLDRSFGEQEQEYPAAVTEGPGASTSSSKVTLTEELTHKIVKQVEYYFSDSNLPTDKYLMKFVKKDPEGFVPIPVVASFKKVKNLVSNHALVGAALRTSSQLVVSEDGKKVRRLNPLPDIDIEEVQSRTVLAENLPNDYSIQNLEKLFGSVGNVKMVRVCNPQGPNGSSQVLTRFSKTDMVVSSKVADLNDERNWRSGLRVQLLVKRMGKYGHQTRGRKMENADTHGEEDDAVTCDVGNDKQLKVSAQHAERYDDVDGDGHHPNERNGGRRSRGRGRGKARGRGQNHGNGRGHTAGAALSSNSNSSEVLAKQPPGPRMPDGTRGFTMGRGRPMADGTI